MTLPSQPLPTIGAVNSTEDPKLRAVLAELQTILSGNVDLTNIATSLLWMATGGDRKINMGGVTTNDFSGSKSVQGTITHGLGAAPTVVLLTPSWAFGSGQNRTTAASPKSVNSTAIDYIVEAVDGTACTGTVGLYWLAAV